MIPSFRVSGHFPPFRLLGFGVIFRRSAVPRFRLLGIGLIFRRSAVPSFRRSTVPSFRLLGLPLELSMLCYALMNSIFPSTNQVLPLLEQPVLWTWERLKLLQSAYFFCHFTPMLKTPAFLPTGILFSSSFARIKMKIKMGAVKLNNSTSMISQKNRGLWTVYHPH